MMQRRLMTFLLALFLALPGIAAAQATTLIADQITFGGSDVVIAQGNVEILAGTRRVRATQIIYNQRTETLDITGPIVVVDMETGAVLTGEAAQIDTEFQNGVIEGARFLLEEQLQIAAAEMTRVDGRYNQLYKAVASSCVVCPNNPTPLWQIRAKRIAHDQEAQQLYFDNAWFEVAGVPVFYFPRLRMPDPTQTRASGFLVPQIRNSSTLGVGFKFPYFRTIGEHTDLLITPYISNRTTTVEGRFRREFSFGSLELEGAVSQDSLTTHSARAYLFAKGRFRLPRDFDLNVDLRLVSDNTYLLTYDYSDVDRLTSEVEITRTSRNRHISLSYQNLRSLRDAEITIQETLATNLGRATYERRFFPGLIDGEARLVFDLEGHIRKADTVSAGLLANCATAGLTTAECTARDVTRLGVLANWRRDWTTAGGIVGAAKGQIAADGYQISQDPSFSGTLGHVTPTAALELRYPMARTTARGDRDLLEPLMQIAWTDTIGTNVPNEDSELVEFDEGNLLDLSRFPGSDRYERGLRSTVGFRWTRWAATGQGYHAVVGRVYRLENLGQFTDASGLDGSASDWLVAAQFKGRSLTVTNRSLFGGTLDFAKSETQLAWHGDRVSATGSYIYVVEDAAEGRDGDTSELNFDADYRFARHWTANINGRYDGFADEATHGGIGLSYQNECVNIDFSVSRRFTTSTNLVPSTDFGLQVSLNGFGQDGRANARTCQMQQI